MWKTENYNIIHMITNYYFICRKKPKFQLFYDWKSSRKTYFISPNNIQNISYCLTRNSIFFYSLNMFQPLHDNKLQLLCQKGKPGEFYCKRST